MRLIEKVGENTYGALVENYLVYEKLCQLEDIEEELGIDLITLIKAIRNGVFIKGQETQYPLALIRKHYSSGKTKYYVFHDGREKEIKLNKYGKTWALMKEELEK